MAELVTHFLRFSNNRLLKRAEKAEARVRELEAYHTKALEESSIVMDLAVNRIEVLEKILRNQFGTAR